MYFNCMAGHLLSMGLIGSFCHVLPKLLIAVIRQKNFSLFLTWVKILSFYSLVRQLKEFLSDEFLLVSVQTITEKSRPVFCVLLIVDISLTYEHWKTDLIYLLFFLLLLAFGFFSVFFFLLLIKVKFWYRTGCWPAASIYE